MESILFLTPTDTIMGFVSQNVSKIDNAKRRKPKKHYIRTVKSFELLKCFGRVPNRYKNKIRRSKKTTFIMPNGFSFRVVKGTIHNLLLDRVGWFYSSSANLSGAEYDKEYAKEMTEVIVSHPQRGKTAQASKIYRLGIKTIKLVR